MEKAPRKVIDSYWRNPRIYGGEQQENQPVVLKPRKVIYSYFRIMQPFFRKPRKVIDSYWRNPHAA